MKTKELHTLTKISLIIGVLLDYIDELLYNKSVFQMLKRIANKFKSELEKHEKIYLHGADEETMQTFVDGYESINKLIDFNLSLSENQLKYFNEDLEKLINKYKKQ